MAYARGNLAWGLCMRCGFRYLLRELVFDGYFPNIRVCTGCYDAPQPQEKLAIVSDPVALWRPSPDSYYVPPPFLQAEVGGAIKDSNGNLVWDNTFDPLVDDTEAVLLSWTSICSDAVGENKQGAQGAQLSRGYAVYRSSDAVTYALQAILETEPDEFGALSIETLYYIDAPGAGTWYYFVLGCDVLTKLPTFSGNQAFLTTDSGAPIVTSDTGQEIEPT